MADHKKDSSEEKQEATTVCQSERQLDVECVSLGDNVNEISDYDRDKDRTEERDDSELPNQEKDNEDEESRNGRCCCRSLVMRCFKKWPKLSSFCFGVVLPLWSLICISLLFGYGLARLEAPNEIERNDLIVSNAVNASYTKSNIQNLTASLPRACWELLLYPSCRGDANMSEALSDIYLNPEEHKACMARTDRRVGSNENVVVDVSSASFFLDECGYQGQILVNEYVTKGFEATAEASSDLTFDWIQCVPQASGLGDHYSSNVRNEDLRPEAQASFFISTWNLDQEAIYESIFKELGRQYRLTGQPENPEIAAFQEAIKVASGAEGCQYNTAGSAWFWFTIMTTIGYGNQSPETTGGRAMVYTLGFLSILSFGCVLAVAGNIVSNIMDDAIHSCKIARFFKPWIVWGVIYYGWMLIIAGMAIDWKKRNLGSELSLRDGYWYAYISTTTVGLGDIFLEPSVLRFNDLTNFSLMFLIGFVFLSVFLQKFSKAIQECWRLLRGSEKVGSRSDQTALVYFHQEQDTERSRNMSVSQGQ